MKQLIFTIAVLFSATLLFAQEGINYDESKVPVFTAPDPLTFNDGTKVTTVSQWENRRRAELLEMFAAQMYGRTPKDKIKVSYETLSENPDFLNGKATAKQVKFIFTNGRKKHEAVLLLVLPNATAAKTPVFFAYNYKGNHSTTSDPSILLPSFFPISEAPAYYRKWPEGEWGRGCASNYWPYEMIIERGYGVATMSYQDIYPDTNRPDAEEHAVTSLFQGYQSGPKKPDQWGALGAWAWGSSRVLDYLETQKRVDMNKIVTMGHSRHGKAALWAGAQDKRFKIVISNNSGCGGAAMSKRVYGENVARITTVIPYWFCPDFGRYADNEATLPFDQHELVALMAPRKVYIASAIEDRWADPKGEFLAGYHAGPVYELYGLRALGTDRQPVLHEPIMADVGYHIRAGGHAVTDYDWMRYMDFADQHFYGQEARQRYLEESLLINEKARRGGYRLRVTAQDSTWADWQKRTGELPPDFSRMPSTSGLPDPLLLDGYPITTQAQWEQKKEQIRDRYQYWISGYRPPAPESFRTAVVSERTENGVKIQLIELRFGPDDQAKMTFELLIPPGTGPFPVYMTQWNHRNWAQLALRRGYIACIYAGGDSKDDTQAYQALYPDYDFSCLMRRAWGASRVIDYLYTRPEVNTAQIAITGHSRNGKQSLWAAAFDERITAVVSSSCGTGGMTPFRYSDPQYCNQTLDDIAAGFPQWFHPRMRFFFGKEDKLPVDQNLLLSLIAPRALLLHYSMVERQLNPWVCEQCYLSVRNVYSFLDVEEKIGIFPRYGEHAVMTRDVEQCIDFLDIQFGRKQGSWTNRLYYDYSFDRWKAACTIPPATNMPPVAVTVKETGTSIAEKQALARTYLSDLLGSKPASARPSDTGPTTTARMDWIDLITGRPQVKNASVVTIGPYTGMGDHLQGYLYCPEQREQHKKVPVVLFLHQYAFNHGFAHGYGSALNTGSNSQLFQYLIDNGFAVMAIDMLGFGSRIEEGSRFYERFPCWSKMGQMVADVDACMDAVGQFDFLNADKVFLVGNTIGGTTALIAAALNEKIAGAAVLSGFSPWRESTAQDIGAMSQSYGFVPNLGFWADQPEQVPVDFPEIMTCIAPRPLMVIAPSLDRHIKFSQVENSMKAVKHVYTTLGYPQNIQFETPVEISRLTNDMRGSIVEFLRNNL